MNKEGLYKFFEGTASLEEEQAIRKWLDTSSDNWRILLKERKLFDAMLLNVEEIGSTAQDTPVKREKRRSSLRTELVKIAAVVVLTLGLNTFYHLLFDREGAVAMQTITVPAGQRVNIMLPDGSNVWLNARTTLRYPFAFRRDARRVELDGEAYFDVTKDKKHPFIVETSKAKIEVKGTQFNVDAYADREEFETTLMSGSVRITSAAYPLDIQTLAPDSKAYLENGRLKVVPVDDYNPYRWKEGLICFRNETFRNIMKDFEKYYGINIQVENKRVLKYFYTGKFRQADGIDYALRVLQKDILFQYRRDDEQHIIFIK